MMLLSFLFFSFWLHQQNVDGFQNVVIVGGGQRHHKPRRTTTRPHSSHYTGKLFLKSSSANNNNNNVNDNMQQMNDDPDDNAQLLSSFRFLGRGSNAIVRPGCVLVAPSNEYHTFYRRAAIFIYGMGTSNSQEDDSNDYLIRGLIIDYPTPFTLCEMMNHNPQIVKNPLGNNFLFRGGDKGGDGVILLHNQKSSNTEIGTSGIYQGGWDAALEACQTTTTTTTIVNNYKAFFNYCEFTEKELSDMLDTSRGGNDDNESDDDTWMSVEVNADFVLNQDWDRGDAWTRLRKAIRQQEEELQKQQQQQQQQQSSIGSDGATATAAPAGTEDFS